MNEEHRNLSQHYQVNVVILEGRHLALNNANTQVKISIGNRKKKIHAKTNKTDSPYYNDFCTFHFNLPLDVLLDEVLVISVYQIAKLIKKLLGRFSVELATIWSQPDHQFHHKWAVLLDPKNPTSSVKGYLKCDIAILATGVVIKPPEDHDDNEELEENILVPYGGIRDRHRARLIFSVFRADNLSFSAKVLYSELNVDLLQPYVRITYGGNVRKTSVAKNKESPVWNEELAFDDLFPPLSQNICVELCDQAKPRQKNSLGNTNIDIRNLYENGYEGFLPTFGPNFIYLYRPFKKLKRYRTSCSLQNSFTYVGRLLLAIRMETFDYPEEVIARKMKIKFTPKPIPPLLENAYFEYNKFILFAAIFDVLFFDSKLIEKNISFSLTIGPKRNAKKVAKRAELKKETKSTNVSNQLEEPKHLNLITNCNTTPNQKCSVKADYSFIAFAGKFPCVHVFGEWPDSLRRMYRSNVIKKVVQNFTHEINKIKNEVEHMQKNPSGSSQKLKDIMADLSKSCEIILLLTKTMKFGDTNLYKEKKNFYHKEIAQIVEKTKMASSKDALKTEDVIPKISAYLATLAKYAQDPENSFPDTEIWIRKNGKTTAQCRIKTEDVVYSSNSNERGIFSGKMQTILIEEDKNKIKAKLDMFIWFGLAENFMECLKMLPGGFKHEHKTCSSNAEFRIPSEIINEEVHHFQCRVHIFQAKIMMGFDSSGLADPFVRIIILGQNQVSQIRKATLSPIWDETLIFPNVTLHGPQDFIKNNSVSVIVEIFDKEKLNKSELIGRCLVKPVVKLKDEKYEPPNFPPKLGWERIFNESEEVGQILMVSELLEISDNLKDLYAFTTENESLPLSIPLDIRPQNIKHRLEIIFWGMREMKKKSSLKNKVFVTLECGENLIKSSVVKNVRHKLNFPRSFQIIELNLPEEPEYAPPLSLKLFHIASVVSSKTYVATSIVPSLRQFYCPFFENWQKQNQIQILGKKDEKKEKKKKKKLLNKSTKLEMWIDKLFFAIVKFYRYCMCKMFKKCKESAFELKPEETEEKMSWWIKYHASLGAPGEYPGVPTFKVYHEELESQPEFQGFTDFLYTFNMKTGHEKKRHNVKLMAKVKVVLKLYRWPSENELTFKNNETFEKGLLSRAPINEPIKFVLRAYIICGKNLAPRDVYGKSDPYLFLQLGDKSVHDRENYAPKQINPTFGKCFEIKGVFPHDHLLRIKVIDYDVSSKDDLIGETLIDIENRYYSKYHASCGIATHFQKDGVNAWRDIYLPSDILNNVCEQSFLGAPTYENDRVVIEGHEFVTPVSSDTLYKQEVQALHVLNRWNEFPLHGYHVVPEHIETRSLYHPAIPGIEQGKLQMWIDVFPADYRFMPPKVDITPDTAVPMELRAIVWNVDEVVLDDKSVFFNDRMSDIYVRGWILSLEEETQKTDIHYRSLNGEGNFNWRFIFHFNYISSERMMTVKKKIDAFDLHPEERKHRCKLEIQIWDNDAFGDDYLGTLILELCSMPRGAKLSSRCTLKMLTPNATHINLFKIRKTRGWWPFRRLRRSRSIGNEFELTGKIDLELEILTETEAQQQPAGKGREEPNGLPPPDRPATSFNWMLNPWKTFRYIILKKMAKTLIIVLLIALVVFFILTAIYAFPNYLVKKLLNA